MDPSSVILAALTAGAEAIAKEIVGSAIKETVVSATKDAYEGLKSLIKKKCTGKAVGAAVDAYAAEPESAEAILRPALKELAIDREDALLAAAEKLLAMADSDGSVRQRYVLQVAGNVQGVVQGDHANVTMNFGGDPLQKG